ncbi:MAG: succinate dehydrogenase, hydrophobic membrane anchor protein [Gammaproteobacteria bacterium]|nr:succinate dehydrogenase, hydrophobic membrane anchor protein [Gammaproteobacteria bacterium]
MTTRRLHGLRAWLLQRISAVYLAAYVVFLAYHFAVHAPASYAAWYAWVGSPWVSISGALFFAALMIHAWVGVRDVIMDYVHVTGLRLALLAALGLLLLGYGLWAMQVLLAARLT